MGKLIIMDDSMPVVAGGTSGFKYTSILFGTGAFGYGNGSVDVPVELESQAAQGNGAGVQTLFTRKNLIIHPFGFKDDGTPAAESYTPAELAAAATWDRVVDRKNIPMAFIVTNG